jgi:hypothetical protein
LQHRKTVTFKNVDKLFQVRKYMGKGKTATQGRQDRTGWVIKAGMAGRQG